ncbi:hypothetical protein EDB83DRAFT_924124 [Lactarius deliciosus]|nr:hypothetical protein EDB83DRAFT_924124 [Lactarius deliciosus]
MPPKPTFPISTVWSDIQQSTLILPAEMTAARAWDIHSMPNLLCDFDANTTPIQFVPHRGIPEYTKAIPDGSIEALQRVIVGKKGEGGNAVELDPLWITGNPYIMHDLTGDRQTLSEGPWSRWAPGQHTPKYIQRDVEGAEFTEKYILANDPFAPLLDCMWELLLSNSAVTIFLDGCNDDAAKLVALVSNHPAYHNNALVQCHCYPYTFRNGVEFVDRVGELNPAADWKRTVSVTPVLNPDMLPALAGVRKQLARLYCTVHRRQGLVYVDDQYRDAYFRARISCVWHRPRR